MVNLNRQASVPGPRSGSTRSAEKRNRAARNRVRTPRPDAEHRPDEELDLLALALEAGASRAWGGIHFPIDNDAGQLLGRCVGYLVLEEAREKGGA
jgi:hypothetical protein